MKFVFSVATKRAGSTVKEEIEVPDNELVGMSQEVIHEYVYEAHFRPWLESNLDVGFSKVDDEK